MTKTIIALHDEARAASRSVCDLVEHGFLRDDISLVTPALARIERRNLFFVPSSALGGNPDLAEKEVVEEIRATLSGLDTIKVPGIGPVFAAGPLAAELSIYSSSNFGRTAHGRQRGLMGALMKLSVPEERAHYYAEGIRRGGTLVMVRTPDYRARDAVEIINRYEPVDINRRAREWRLSGWTGFKSA